MKKAIAAFGVLAACAVTAANACTVRVTTWGGSYQNTYERLVGEFEENENCKVQWVVGGSPDHLIKARLGQVDVATNTLLNSIAGEKEGLWMPLTEDQVPNMANLYERARFSDETIFVNVGDHMLVYNTDHITEEPQSWDIFWDPEYQQRVVIYGFLHEPTLGLAALQAEKNGGSIDDMEPGLKKMAELYTNGNLIGALDVESQIVSLLQTGDAWLAMLATGRIKELLDKGVTNVEATRPEEGTFPIITTMNVTKKANNPEMAMKFVDYVLSERWQKEFAVANLYGPTVSGVELPEDFEYEALLLNEEEFSRLYLPGPEKMSAQRSDWQNQLDRMIVQ